MTAFAEAHQIGCLIKGRLVRVGPSIYKDCKKLDRGNQDCTCLVCLVDRLVSLVHDEPNTMNNTMIARAVLRTFELHENSYHKRADENLGTYQRSKEECARQAARELGLEDGFGTLLWLLSTWQNDVNEWAKKIMLKESSDDQ